jgi:hypothetical protein
MDKDNDIELYVASAAGGAEPVKVSVTLVVGGDVLSGFSWSPLSN